MPEIGRGKFTGTQSSWGIYDAETEHFYSQEDIGRIICYEIFPNLHPGEEYNIKINVEIVRIGKDGGCKDD